MENSTCPVVVDGKPCESGQRIVLGLCCYHYRQRRDGRPFTVHVRRRSQGASLKRDHLGRKECGRCGRWLDTSNFTPSKKADGYQTWCSGCASDYMLTRRYGLTKAEVERLVDAQGGCAMCHTERPRNEGFRNGWHVDHDHACCPGDVSCGSCIRGVLCADCNKLIGLVDDSPIRLAQAVNYLRDCETRRQTRDCEQRDLADPQVIHGRTELQRTDRSSR